MALVTFSSGQGKVASGLCLKPDFNAFQSSLDVLREDGIWKLYVRLKIWNKLNYAYYFVCC